MHPLTMMAFDRGALLSGYTCSLGTGWEVGWEVTCRDLLF